MHELFRFPNPVNEVSARLVAAGVVLMSLAAIVFDQEWILVPLAYGFVARVLTGPTLSPLGQFVTRVVTPRVPFAPKHVPGTAEALRAGHRRDPLGRRARSHAFGFDNPTLAVRARRR